MHVNFDSIVYYIDTMLNSDQKMSEIMTFLEISEWIKNSKNSILDNNRFEART